MSSPAPPRSASPSAATPKSAALSPDFVVRAQQLHADEAYALGLHNRLEGVDLMTGDDHIPARPHYPRTRPPRRPPAHIPRPLPQQRQAHPAAREVESDMPVPEELRPRQGVLCHECVAMYRAAEDFAREMTRTGTTPTMASSEQPANSARRSAAFRRVRDLVRSSVRFLVRVPVRLLACSADSSSL